jgi:hypothetical protein
MVLSREKRSNAGKAPQRLDEAIANTPPPSAQSKASKRAVAKARSVSVVSQGPSRPKKSVPAVSKRAKSVPKAQATQPASLRREEDISTASPSIQGLSSDDEDLEALGEGLGLQEGLEEAEKIGEDREDDKSAEVEWEPFSVELRVMLGKRAIHNSQISAYKLNFDFWASDAHRRAEEAAAKLKKGIERLGFNASIKYGTGRPYELTVEDAGNILDVYTQVDRVRASNKSSSQAQLHVSLVAMFEPVECPDEDSDSSAQSEEISSTQKTHKWAHSEAKAPSKNKKAKESATERQQAAIETERAIQAAIESLLLIISRLHKCSRVNCSNFDHICIDPGYEYGHCPVNINDLQR